MEITGFKGGLPAKLTLPSGARGPSYQQAILDDYQRCSEVLDDRRDAVHTNHKISWLVSNLDVATGTLATVGVIASMMSGQASLNSILSAGLTGLAAFVCVDLTARALLKVSPKLLSALPDSNMPLSWPDSEYCLRLDRDQAALAQNLRAFSECAPYYEVSAQLKPETLAGGQRVLTGAGGTLVERVGQEWKIVSPESSRDVPSAEFMENFGLWGGNLWGRKDPERIKDSQVLPMSEAMGESELDARYLARCGYHFKSQRHDNFRLKPVDASMRIENGEGLIASRWQSQSVKFFTTDKREHHYALGDLQATYGQGGFKPHDSLPAPLVLPK